MGKITITIEAASLEEAREMMRVKALGDIGAVGFNPERSPLCHFDFSQVNHEMGTLDEIRHTEIPKPTAPTEQPATEPSAPTAPGAASVESATTTQTSAAVTAPISETAPPATAPATSMAGVELDSDGLPWDSRIHSSSRKKLAKTQQWKKARGVDADLVARVEAELRQAMAIPAPQRPESMAQSDHAREMAAGTGAPKPETPATTVGEQVSPTASAVTTAEPAAAPATELTPPTPSRSAFAESDAAAAFAPPPPAQAPSAPASAPKTLAELNALVLGAGMQLADVLPAVQEAGLASYALLGTRPDLIPEVARKLGLGG